MTGSLILLIGAAALVALVHSVLPDHWVPLAVVGRTQGWSLPRVARISGFAALGHVVASLLLAGAVALVGLRFQSTIESQQGHLVGGILIITGLGLLFWGLTGHGHAHDHAAVEGHSHHGGPSGSAHAHDSHDHGVDGHDVHEHDIHNHAHTEPIEAEHGHRHEHEGRIHEHPHSHEEFIAVRRDQLREQLGRGRSGSRVSGRLVAYMVPLGVAASPDLTVLPIALAAAAHGRAAVVWVLGVFSVVTIITFVGLTVIGVAAGYQIRGRWLEEHANTATSLVLIAIGLVAFFGF